tara:strand:+ start:2846 stop:4258 length:1413 start_codon:yes stop_codon:yes gene_type:complete
MKYFIISFFLSNILFLSSQDKWTYLIDDDLSNWEIKEGNAEFIIDDGIITGTSILKSPSTYLGTKINYKDFILEFEVNVSSGLNSGVQFRSLKSDHLRNSVYGYQLELEADKPERNRLWSGGIYDQSRRSIFLYPLSVNPIARSAFKSDEWNFVRIEAIGNSIRTWINGIQCSNLIDDTSTEGFIALQIHSIGKQSLEGKTVKWKNIRIITNEINNNRYPVEDYAHEINNIDNFLTKKQKEDGWKFIFDGNTSNGWVSAKSDSFPSKGWKINNGILSVLSSNGKESENGGDIVTKDKYENFEFELDFKITKGANSGIKYFVDLDLNKGAGSAIGLEYQILDNKFHLDASKKFRVMELEGEKWELKKEDIKRNRGVASLYDLIEAEKFNHKSVSAGQWHRAKIISNNGYVEHWLDNEKVLEYNRFSQVFKALIQYSKYSKWENFGQLESGHILLQDHGGEVSFKNIKIREF